MSVLLAPAIDGRHEIPALFDAVNPATQDSRPSQTGVESIRVQMTRCGFGTRSTGREPRRRSLAFQNQRLMITFCSV